MSQKWPTTSLGKYITPNIIHKGMDHKESEEVTAARSRGDVDFILKDRPTVSMLEITQVDEASKCVIIEGAPGVGKSRLSWELCRNWDQLKSLKQFNLVLWVDVRSQQSKTYNLVDLIYHHYAGLQRAVAEEIEMSEGEGILVVMDELTEEQASQKFLLMELLHGTYLPKALIIVFCSSNVAKMLSSDSKVAVDKHLEIIGFTENDIVACAQHSFGESTPGYVGFKNYLINNPHVSGLLYLPLNCAILTEVYKGCLINSPPVTKTLTQTLTSLTRALLLRHMIHSGIVCDTYQMSLDIMSLPQPVLSSLMHLSNIAFDGICCGQIAFRGLDPKLHGLGLTSQVSVLEPDGPQIIVYFLHRALQEYLAAIHMSLLSADEQQKLFAENYNTQHFRNVLLFLAGLTGFKHIDWQAAKLQHELLPPTIDSSSEEEEESDRLKPANSVPSEEAFYNDSVPPTTHYGSEKEESDHPKAMALHSDSVPPTIDYSSEEDEKGDRLKPANSIPPEEAFYSDSVPPTTIYCSEKEESDHPKAAAFYSNSVPPTIDYSSEEDEESDHLKPAKVAPPEEAFYNDPVIFHLVYEAQKSDACEHIFTEQLIIFQPLQNPATPFDLYTIGYCIAQSPTSWVLDFRFQNVSQECFHMLRTSFSTQPQILGRLASISGYSDATFGKVGLQECMQLPKSILEGITDFEMVECKVCAEILADMICLLPNLRCLTVSENPTGSGKAVLFLKELLKHQNIEELSIDCAHFEPEDVSALAEVVSKSPHLEELSVDGMDLSPLRLEQLLSALFSPSPTLMSLRIWKANIQACPDTFQHLKCNTNLVKLLISECIFETQCALSVAEALLHNKTLLTLQILGSAVAEEGAKGLAKMLSYNRTLKNLALIDRSLGRPGVLALVECLAHNKSLEKLLLSATYKAVIITGDFPKDITSRVQWF